MAVARPTESASITQPHAYVNSIGFSDGVYRIPQLNGSA
jgi:hypothetical protein